MSEPGSSDASPLASEESSSSAASTYSSSPQVVPEAPPEVISPVPQKAINFGVNYLLKTPEWNLDGCLKRYSLLMLEFKRLDKAFRNAFETSGPHLCGLLQNVKRLSVRKYDQVIKNLKAESCEFDDSYNIAKAVFHTPFQNLPEPERNAVKVLRPHAARMKILRVKFERKERFMDKVIAATDHMNRVQSMLKRLRRNLPILICIYSMEQMQNLVAASAEDIRKILNEYK